MKSTVAASQALVQGAVDAVGLESCRQFGALSTSLAIQNGTTRTEAVATEARLSASIYQQANAAAMQAAQGFNQVERGQDQLQRSIQETACDTQKQLAECCCEMRSGIKDVQTGILMSESRLAAQATANTQRIVDLITSEKINALETENSNLRQSSTIRDALDRQLNVILAHFHPTTAGAAVAAAR